MFFGAVCGSSTGTVAAIGSIMMPSMEENKYNRGFAGAIISVAGSLGILIPPSIPMIIYAVSQGVSVADLFTAGIEVGIISGVALITYIILKSKKCGYVGTDHRPTLKEVWIAFKDALLALLMPVIILGGIYGGIFTPTEAAAVACLYAFFVGCFVYKQFSIKDFPKILLEAGPLLTSGSSHSTPPTSTDGLLKRYAVKGEDYLDDGFGLYAYDDNADPWGMCAEYQKSVAKNPVAFTPLTPAGSLLWQD